MENDSLKKLNNFRIDELCFILDAFLNNNFVIIDSDKISRIEKDLLLLESYTGIPSHVKDFNIEIREAIKLFDSFQIMSLDMSPNSREINLYKQFHENREDLRKFIKTIKSFINLNICSASLKNIQASEGKSGFFRHFARERDWKIIKAKKLRFLIENGFLFCEVCGFDFAKKYGNRGVNFIEVHHKTPLSEVDDETITNLDDLCLLCSNCHKILHRKQPWLTVRQLKEIIFSNEVA